MQYLKNYKYKDDAKMIDYLFGENKQKNVNLSPLALH